MGCDVQIVNNRWEVAVTVSDGQFAQVSFVNSICTYKGGTHVTYVADQVVRTAAHAPTSSPVLAGGLP